MFSLEPGTRLIVILSEQTDRLALYQSNSVCTINVHFVLKDNIRTLRSAATSNHLAKVNIDGKLMD